LLNFDEGRYVAIQSGAVALAPELRVWVGQAFDTGVSNVFFVGSGGAGILMEPAAQLLRNRSLIHCIWEMPAELVSNGSPRLGPSAFVVMPSLSGTTPETLKALEYCHHKGALVMALTGDSASPLASAADVNFTVPAADDTSSESFYLQSVLVALAVMDARKEIDDYPQIVSELEQLPGVLLDVKRGFEDRAAALAQDLAAGAWHIITGAGNTWAEAFYYGMCILEEMQWIRTRPVHAADFFHGTLELVEPGVNVITLKGEGASRDLVERVERFVPRVGGKLTTLDAKTLVDERLSPAVRPLVSPALLAAALERVSAHLEVLRDHPLTLRRYYRQMEY
jgi:fructoselysine-6-phosphate deglycase